MCTDMKPKYDFKWKMHGNTIGNVSKQGFVRDQMGVWKYLF